MSPEDNLYGVIKNGVLTLGSGYGASIRVEREQLIIRDGGAELKFSRAHCPVSRVLIVRSEGYVTVPALRWLHEIGATLVVLKYDGTPIVTSVSRHGNIPAALRRAQAITSVGTRLGASIARDLIRAKIAGQAANLRWLGMHAAAEETATMGERLSSRPNAADLLGAEGMASVIYWRALAETPLQFGKRQAVPDHWKILGPRHSTITGAPRGAVTPGNALLNYCYSVLVSELTIALHAVGLDPALGILHADKDNRPSLAYDLIEPCRPILERWLLQWLREATFSKRDFREDLQGLIRVMHPLNSHLAMTAAVWRSYADQIVQWLYKRLSGEKARLRQFTGAGIIERDAARRAMRWRVGNQLQRPIPTTCLECGKALAKRRRKFCSDQCAKAWHGGKPFEAGLAAIARARVARAERGESAARPVYRIDAVPISEWRTIEGWSAERDADMRTWFVAELQPELRQNVRPADIRRALRCSGFYSVEIKHGRRIPHPRLMRPLANLVKVEYPENFP